MAKNGPVDFMEQNNDSRTGKGTVGLGLPADNDYRAGGGGGGGEPVSNDRRAAPGGDVMLVTEARKV